MRISNIEIVTYVYAFGLLPSDHFERHPKQSKIENSILCHPIGKSMMNEPNNCVSLAFVHQHNRTVWVSHRS
jgi:hypothetical protein